MTSLGSMAPFVKSGCKWKCVVAGPLASHPARRAFTHSPILGLSCRGTSKETRGTAYIVYDDIYDAKTACDHLSGFNVANRYLIVLYYNPLRKNQKVSKSPSPRRVHPAVCTPHHHYGRQAPPLFHLTVIPSHTPACACTRAHTPACSCTADAH